MHSHLQSCTSIRPCCACDRSRGTGEIYLDGGAFVAELKAAGPLEDTHDPTLTCSWRIDELQKNYKVSLFMVDTI